MRSGSGAGTDEAILEAPGEVAPSLNTRIHDLANIANNVYLHAELLEHRLKRGATSAEVSRHVRGLRSEAQRLRELLDAVREVAPSSPRR